MKTNLYLARHGQTQWNKVHRFQGQLDSELTETGKQQSNNITLQLVNKKIELIASSTLGRALSSAAICQQRLNVPIAKSIKLIERDLGIWQGQYVDNIKSDENYNEILHQYTELTPKDGESAVSCANRIYQALEVLSKNNLNKNILVIFHGEALRCFLAKLGHISSENAYQLFDNGCVFQFTYQHDTERFQRIT